MKLVTVARLLRVRGNKGELAAAPFTSQYARLKNVLVNQVPMEIEQTWMHGDQVIFKFKGIDTISDAEPLAGAEVAIPIDERAELAAGEYYQSDLVGCQVVEENGNVLGTVEGWEETGATPLVQVKSAAGKEILIPFAKAMFTKIDLEHKRIEVKLPEGLADLN